jgi:hypothetical protein
MLDPLKGISLRYALALLANIRLARNRTNTLAYYKHSKITPVKSFITTTTASKIMTFLHHMIKSG